MNSMRNWIRAPQVDGARVQKVFGCLEHGKLLERSCSQTARAGRTLKALVVLRVEQVAG